MTITGRHFSPDPFSLGDDSVGNKVTFINWCQRAIE